MDSRRLRTSSTSSGQSLRDDLLRTESSQEAVEDLVCLGIGNSEIAFVGLPLDQIGAAGLVTITSGTLTKRANAQTWVLNRSPIGLTGGESSACQVK